MKTDLSSMMKKFGDRITATQSDTHPELSLSGTELDRMKEWASTNTPVAPSQDPLGDLKLPQRPGAIDAGQPAHIDLVEQTSWYGGRALFNLLTRRGFTCSEDDCHLVAALSHFRPFGFLDDFLTQVYERPQDINSAYATSLQRSIDGTEMWLQMLHESKVFREIVERPVSKSDFAKELRDIGSVNDPHIAHLAVFSAKQGDKVLMPGGSVILGLDHVSDFYLDTLSDKNGTPRCAGMREFQKLISDLIRSNDPTLKEIGGRAMEREISDLTAPLIGEVLSNPLARYRVTGQLMFLRDGLLRLCNKRLSGIQEAVRGVSPEARVGKLIGLVEPTQSRQESFLINHKVDLALLSEKPKVFELVSNLIECTPKEQRLDYFHLITTAPKLLECLVVLSSNTKQETLAAAIPDLMRPLTYLDPPTSLAQRTTEYHDAGNRGVARLMFDNRSMLAQTLNTAEGQDVGRKLFSALSTQVREGARGGQIAAMVAQVGESVRQRSFADADTYLTIFLGERGVRVPTVAPPPANTETVPAPNPPNGAQDRRTPGWGAWAADLTTSTEASETLRNDMERFGDTAWYKQILLTPSSLSEYISALNSGDTTLHQAILARNRTELSQEAHVEKKRPTLSDFKKVVFIGGLQDQSREAKIRELLPDSCDASFYYADASASSFRNMTALSLAGEGQALAVYLPNFTSHSMYYKACDLAESAGAKLIVLPKGAQNPRVVVERIHELLA